MKPSMKAILLGGVIGATLDIAYAFSFFGWQGVSPVRILQSIASGVLGAASFTGGNATAALGLVLHYMIAIAAAAVFYAASGWFKWLVRHPVIGGAVFGVGVYAFMNLVVLPLSAVPRRPSFVPLAFATDLLSHMFLFGVPIALCARAARLAGRRGDVAAA
jgi:uncharacterized membrane protein YagU involved in acid resistance